MPCYFWVVHRLQFRGFEGFGAVVASGVLAGAIVVIPNSKLPPFAPQCEPLSELHGILRVHCCLTIVLVFT